MKERNNQRAGAKLLSSFLTNRLELQEDRLIQELDELIAYASSPKPRLKPADKKQK